MKGGVEVFDFFFSKLDSRQSNNKHIALCVFHALFVCVFEKFQ